MKTKTRNEREMKSALRNRDIPAVEKIIEQVGFNETIKPENLPFAFAYSKELEEKRKRAKPRKIVTHPTSSVVFEDRTNYLDPFTKGFVRKDGDGNIAGYGVLEESFVFETRKIEPSHHFFFITREKEEGDLVELLTAKAERSPRNPASSETFKRSFAHSALTPTLVLGSLVAIANEVGASLSGIDVLSTVSRYCADVLNTSQENAVSGLGALSAVALTPLGYKISRKLQTPIDSGTYAKSAILDSDYGIRGFRKYLANNEKGGNL